MPSKWPTGHHTFNLKLKSLTLRPRNSTLDNHYYCKVHLRMMFNNNTIEHLSCLTICSKDVKAAGRKQPVPHGTGCRRQALENDELDSKKTSEWSKVISERLYCSNYYQRILNSYSISVLCISKLLLLGVHCTLGLLWGLLSGYKHILVSHEPLTDSCILSITKQMDFNKLHTIVKSWLLQ